MENHPNLVIKLKFIIEDVALIKNNAMVGSKIAVELSKIL
jgi:hypothetical protein